MIAVTCYLIYAKLSLVTDTSSDVDLSVCWIATGKSLLP